MFTYFHTIDTNDTNPPRVGCTYPMPSPSPRQPRVSNGSQGEKDQEGMIKLVGGECGKKLREALKNLNEFSHCW